MQDYHLGRLYFADASFSRLGPAKGRDDDPAPSAAYWGAHIDKVLPRAIVDCPYRWRNDLVLHTKAGLSLATKDDTGTGRCETARPSSLHYTGSIMMPCRD
jgi:hypothetical protein